MYVLLVHVDCFQISILAHTFVVKVVLVLAKMWPLEHLYQSCLSWLFKMEIGPHFTHPPSDFLWSGNYLNSRNVQI